MKKTLAASVMASALCFEVDLTFTDNTTHFEQFVTERDARTYMQLAGESGVFVDRTICPEPAPQCLQTRFYSAAQVEMNTLTRIDCGTEK